MVTLNDIKSSIIRGDFDNCQMDEILMAIKFARTQLVHQNTRSMVIGTKVKFTNPKSGRIVRGAITKVARKFITVQEGNFTQWRVPANMLEFD
jgi:hypothetical protein